MRDREKASVFGIGCFAGTMNAILDQRNEISHGGKKDGVDQPWHHLCRDAKFCQNIQITFTMYRIIIVQQDNSF